VYDFPICIELTLFFVKNLNIELFSPECAIPMTFWTKYNLKLFGPLVLGASVMSVYALHKFIQSRRGVVLTRMNSPKKMVRLKTKKIATFLGFIFVGLYTSSVSAALSPLNCQSQSDGTYFLIKDASITCFDESWRSHLAAIVFGILAFMC
jgi:hypothetical protein